MTAGLRFQTRLRLAFENQSLISLGKKTWKSLQSYKTTPKIKSIFKLEKTKIRSSNIGCTQTNIQWTL